MYIIQHKQYKVKDICKIKIIKQKVVKFKKLTTFCKETIYLESVCFTRSCSSCCLASFHLSVVPVRYPVILRILSNLMPSPNCLLVKLFARHLDNYLRPCYTENTQGTLRIDRWKDDNNERSGIDAETCKDSNRD